MVIDIEPEQIAQNQVVALPVQPVSLETVPAISPIQQASDKEAKQEIDEDATISDVDPVKSPLDPNDPSLSIENKIAILKTKIYDLETQNFALELRVSDTTKTSRSRRTNKASLDKNLKAIAEIKEQINQLAPKANE